MPPLPDLYGRAAERAPGHTRVLPYAALVGVLLARGGSRGRRKVDGWHISL